MPSSHRSLQDSTVRLPTSSGDRDFEITFDVPGLSSSTFVHTRPFLSYRVAPIGSSGTHLTMELNGTEIVDLSYNSTTNRTMTEIFEHGLLKAGTGGVNKLRVFVPDDEQGSADVSEIIVTYLEA